MGQSGKGNDRREEKKNCGQGERKKERKMEFDRDKHTLNGRYCRCWQRNLYSHPHLCLLLSSLKQIMSFDEQGGVLKEQFPSAERK